jgi:hypothetical protein
LGLDAKKHAALDFPFGQDQPEFAADRTSTKLILR